MKGKFCGSLLLIIILLVLLGCHTDNKPEIIKKERLMSNCEIHQFISVSKFYPIYGTDSLQWLQSEFDSLYYCKLEEINQQITEHNNNLATSRMEYETITNPTMKKAYKHVLDAMELKVVQLNQILDTYTNHMEQTQFGMLKEQMIHYQLNNKKLLGYWVQSIFIGNQGNLPPNTYHRNYLFDVNKKRLLSATKRVPIAFEPKD